MQLITAPLNEVWEFLKLLAQLSLYFINLFNIPETKSLYIGILVVIAILLLWRGYVVLNLGVLVIYFAVGVSYISYLLRGNGNSSEIGPTIILMLSSLILIFFVGKVRFLLVGSLIGIYVFAELLGTFIGLQGSFALGMIGAAVGVFVTRYFDEHFNNFFDNLMSFTTSLIGVIILFLLLNDILDSENKIQSTPMLMCGIFSIIIGIALWYTSVQRDHRITAAEVKQKKREQNQSTELPEPKQNKFGTGFIALLLIAFFFFVGLPQSNRTNKLILPEPMNSFLINFSAYTQKLAMDSNTQRNVDLSEELILYTCPSLACKSNLVVPSGYSVVISEEVNGLGEESATNWYEIPVFFQLVYIPTRALDNEQILPPYPEQTITDND